MTITIDRFFQTIRALHRAKDANVTLTFTLALLPIAGAVGAAVDYSHGNAIKASMHAAADSTALMLAQNLSSGTINTAQLNDKALSYFSAMLNRKEVFGLQVSPTYNAAATNLVLDATGSFKTDFMGLM